MSVHEVFLVSTETNRLNQAIQDGDKVTAEESINVLRGALGTLSTLDDQITNAEKNILITEYASLYSLLINKKEKEIQDKPDLQIERDTDTHTLLLLFPTLVETISLLIENAEDAEVIIANEGSGVFNLGKYRYHSFDGTIRDVNGNVQIKIERTSRKIFSLLCAHGYTKNVHDDYIYIKGKPLPPERMTIFITRLRNYLKPLNGYIEIAFEKGKGYCLIIHEDEKSTIRLGDELDGGAVDSDV